MSRGGWAGRSGRVNGHDPRQRPPRPSRIALDWLLVAIALLGFWLAVGVAVGAWLGGW